MPPLAFVDRGRTRKGSVRIADGYSRSAKRKRRGITCLHCGSFSPFKSNVGCLEEFERLCGAAIFGVGWGLEGFCPGPSLTALSYGMWQVATFVIAMAAGMHLHTALDRVLRL